jgi:hypothetical protein
MPGSVFWWFFVVDTVLGVGIILAFYWDDSRFVYRTPIHVSILASIVTRTPVTLTILAAFVASSGAYLAGRMDAKHRSVTT